MVDGHADVQIPAKLRQLVEQTYGEPGHRWLADLPTRTVELAERWGLRIGDPYEGGTHALVLTVTREDGSPAVLKLPLIDDENYAEADALRAYAGDGAVQLYDHCPDSGAMLLEQAEPGSALLDHPDRDAALIMGCELLRRLRREAPAGVRFPSTREVLRGWADKWPVRQRKLQVSGVDELLPAALARAGQRLSEPDPPPLLVNRDAHLRNIVRARREPWLLIDPKPVVGDPAFEAGFPTLMLMGNRPTPALAASAVLGLARGLAVAPDRVRDWALLLAMESALFVGKTGSDAPPETVRALSRFRSVSACQAEALLQLDATVSAEGLAA